MNRRNLFVIVGLAAALGLGGDAFAERLYGNYRGPDDAKLSDTSQNETTEPTSNEGEQTAGPSAGEASGDGGGIGATGGGDSGGDTGGDTGGGEESGGSEGSGGESGSDIGGGGGTTTGSGAGTAGGGGGAIPSGGGGGGGVGPGGKGKGASASERLELVSWFFEHNREEFLFEVAAERNKTVRIPKGTAAAIFSTTIHDERVRTSVSAEDMDRVFDILKSATIDKESVVRDAAVIALGKIGSEKAVEVLLERLRLESNKAVKQDTALALGLSRSPAAIEPLIEAIKDRNLTEYALLGLGLTGDIEKAAPAVLDYFQNGRKRKASKESLACAAIALGVLRYDEAREVLEGVLKDKGADTAVQVYACQALGQIGGEGAEKALIKAMDGKAQVRRAAVLALGYIPTAASLKALSGKDGLRGNSDPLMAGFSAISAASVMRELPTSEWKKIPDEIREAALAHKKSKLKSQYSNIALAMFGGIDKEVRRYYGEELAGVSADPDTLSAMAMAAGVAEESSVAPVLEEIAKSVSRDPKLASYAALSLGLLGGGPDRASLLRQIYAGVDRHDVRRGAVAALGLVGDRRDVPFLISVITDTKDKWLGRFTRGAAVASIGMIGDSQSVSRLQELLSNPDADTRAFAVSALGYLADKDDKPRLPTLFARNNFRVEFESLKAVMGQL